MSPRGNPRGRRARRPRAPAPHRSPRRSARPRRRAAGGARAPRARRARPPAPPPSTPGSGRPATGRAEWRRWGPYLSERAWGTVREDYSADGDAWDYFPHDHARSRAYRWGEDGIAGICDRYQILCFALALWNGEDPILKERLFGLTGQRATTARTSRSTTSTSTPRPPTPT